MGARPIARVRKETSYDPHPLVLWRQPSWAMTLAVAATAWVVVACGSEAPSTKPMMQGIAPVGSGGSPGVTGGGSGVAMAGSSGAPTVPTGNAGSAGSAMAAAGQGASGAAGQAGGGGSDSAAAGSAGMVTAAGAGGGEGGMAGGAAGMAGSSAAGSGDGPDNNAPCTASMAASAKPTGSGPHKVVVETNADPGINEGTIYRPEDLAGTERYPIYVWGEGGCAQQGLSNQAANGEIASHGYFVIADGTPSGGGGNRSLGGAGAGKPMIAYIDWAIAENNKPCSAYYHKLDITKIATNGFSCGGLMAQGTAADPRLTTWMINSSGGFMADQTLYKATHGPVLIVLGGPSDIAYENGKRDYENLAKLTHPIMLFSKDIGHGGDLFRANGNFTKLNLAWLNWWLKGDETVAGKGFLVGDGCTLCKDSTWEKASANIP